MKKIILILTIATTLFSCAKDGKDGAVGPAGVNGTNGNANVIGSNTVTLNSGNWNAAGLYYYSDINWSVITQDIVNTGVVMVYEDWGSGQWQVLPYVFGDLGRTFSFNTGYVRIRFQNNDNTQTANPGSVTFRVVAIPSNARIVGVDYTNYDEVKGAYNLQD